MPNLAQISTRHLTVVSSAIFLLIVLLYGLLPGLLGVCLGFMLTKALATRFRWRSQYWVKSAATLVSLSPLVLFGCLIAYASGFAGSAVSQYQGMLEHIVQYLQTLRDHLPSSLSGQLPEEVDVIREMVTATMLSHGKNVALASKGWLHGALLAYVGIIVGALIAANGSTPSNKSLAVEIRARAALFAETFTLIVAAQFWIAALNTTLTAFFLLVVLPLVDVDMPYVPALIVLTFVAGLIPIVGNLFCNVVLAVVGLSVSPLVALSCLGFLIGIHKFEYFINANVVGHKTHIVAWEILAVMFIGETIFGVAGLVAAPLFYAYLKREILSE